MWPLLINHFNRHPHGLGYDEDIGEDNRGVKEVSIALDGLKCEGRGDLRGTAAFEKIAVSLGFVIFR